MCLTIQTQWLAYTVWSTEMVGKNYTQFCYYCGWIEWISYECNAQGEKRTIHKKYEWLGSEGMNTQQCEFERWMIFIEWKMGDL